MPLQQLQFRPGVNREGTTLANEGGWFDCDKIRFRSGYPEKIGGWELLSSATFQGTCRSLWNWVSLNSFNLMGVGTELKFYIEYGGTYYDVTPIRRTVTLNNPFATVYDSPIVTVTDTAHGAITGDFVTFSGATTVGGLNLNNEYQITYVDSNTYTITAASPATGTVAAGGGASVSAAYQINNGTNIGSYQVGWGAGLWGGVITGAALTQLNGAIASPSSTTPIVVDSTTGFPASGTIAIDSELITYTSKTGTQFGGTITRGAFGTTAATHLDNTLTYNATNYYGWGQSASQTSSTQLRLWSQSNFGEDLLFSPRQGALYLWQPGTGSSPNVTTRATLVSGTDVPSSINDILVSDSSRIVIAFGCNDYGAYGTTPQDPLLIRWSAQESYTNWTPAATNQAGSFRLSHGSRIIGAIQTRQEIIVWTDAAIYSMQYLGPPYVYGFTLLADNISIVSPNAMATASGVVYWMGVDKFYVYSGRVETLPCSVRTYIYDDINREQFSQFFSGTNEGYSEIWWFYCSANSDVIDKYVIFNYLDRVWYYGTLGRSAWLDSPLRDYPMAATLGNQIVFHEAAVDDGTTNPPTAISSYVQSSDFDIGDGHNYGFVWRMIPDITFDGSTTPSPLTPSVTMTMRPRQNPGSPYGTAPSPTVASTQNYGVQSVYNVQEFTEIIYTRIRGRQMAFKVASDTLGTSWQLGVPRLDVRPDGRR
jgi:hypothetical protein